VFRPIKFIKNYDQYQFLIYNQLETKIPRSRGKDAQESRSRANSVTSNGSTGSRSKSKRSGNSSYKISFDNDNNDAIIKSEDDPSLYKIRSVNLALETLSGKVGPKELRSSAEQDGKRTLSGSKVSSLFSSSQVLPRQNVFL
jgi:hypothetical protein